MSESMFQLTENPYLIMFPDLTAGLGVTPHNPGWKRNMRNEAGHWIVDYDCPAAVHNGLGWRQL